MIEFASHNSQGRQVWDTQSLSELLQQEGISNNRKGTDRWLEQQAMLPATLSITELRDEQDKRLKPQVVDHLLGNAKKRRHNVLFLQVFSFQERFGLFANDAKGSRRWLWNDTPWDINSLREAIAALTQYNGKHTLLFPHAHISSLFRDIWLADKQQPLAIGEHQARLAMAAYPAKLQLNDESVRPIHLADGNSHLDRLEAESIHIMREVLAQAENPVMMYSVGKDSSVMLHLARKAFYPSPPPFPLLHVDTRWKFQEMYQFRDKMAAEAGMDLITHINPDAIDRDISPLKHGSALHTDITKTEGLKQALDHYKFDVAFGGARRDEEKSRAKERVFSFRNSAHRWDPKNQRPELWNLYNGHKHPGESIRVFPISNWTELDIWQYIYRENIPIVPLYYAQTRPVIERDNMLMMVDDERLELLPNEQVQLKQVRFRTLGCYPLTGAIESSADTLQDIILELLQARTSERQGRAIDSDSAASMEKKKQEGYF
ncbi:MAG: sulfate adenylyltransferase subunit CysD [Gammaproteobacteria bacterium]|nr:sulfate adenylyltransferase subunit CysD [Gammaproteobacteria bacterium]MDP6164687.1 sulfate adenylyltransferase subunit CysD [Gammaproteobacteria bacterium]